MVLRQGAGARILQFTERAGRGKLDVLHRVRRGLGGKVELLARRCHQMDRPIEIGLDERGRRKPGGHLAQRGAKGAVPLRERRVPGHGLAAAGRRLGLRRRLQSCRGRRLGDL